MGNIDKDDENSTTSSMGSSDVALLDMLGLSSLNVADETDAEDEKVKEKADSPLPNISDDWLESELAPMAEELYAKEAVYQFPDECSIDAKHMRVLTEEVVRGRSDGSLPQADRTFEGIKVWKDGEILERKTLTRLENFVDAHEGWSELCHGYLPRILSVALGTEMVLFKEKLNLKPPGGR